MYIFIPATRATDEVYQDVILTQAFLGDSCQRTNCLECSPNCQRMSWHICEEWRERIEDKSQRNVATPRLPSQSFVHRLNRQFAYANEATGIS